MAKARYVTVKHGKNTLLCVPFTGVKDAYRSIGTFPGDGDVKTLLGLLDVPNDRTTPDETLKK